LGLITHLADPTLTSTEGSAAAEQADTVPAADPWLLDGVIFGQLGAAPEARAFYSELTEAADLRLRGWDHGDAPWT
jgi:hypothetical protein